MTLPRTRRDDFGALAAAGRSGIRFIVEPRVGVVFDKNFDLMPLRTSRTPDIGSYTAIRSCDSQIPVKTAIKPRTLTFDIINF
jgi:hypothetical protein